MNLVLALLLSYFRQKAMKSHQSLEHSLAHCSNHGFQDFSSAVLYTTTLPPGNSLAPCASLLIIKKNEQLKNITQNILKFSSIKQWASTRQHSVSKVTSPRWQELCLTQDQKLWSVSVAQFIRGDKDWS